MAYFSWKSLWRTVLLFCVYFAPGSATDKKDPAIVRTDDKNLFFFDHVSLEEGFRDIPLFIKCIGSDSDGSDAGWNPDDIRSPIKPPKEGVLEISEVSLSNNGTYRCCLKDVDDKYVVNCSSLELTVTRMTITSKDDENKVESGKTLHVRIKNNDPIGIFTCNSERNHLEWFKIDGSNPVQLSYWDEDHSSLLTFERPAEMADNGTYKCCSVLDRHKKYCAVLDLIVFDDSTKVLVTPATTTLIPGEIITFSCSVNKKDEGSSSTTFSWFFVKWLDYSKGMKVDEMYAKGSKVKNDSTVMVSNGKSNEENPFSNLTILTVSVEHAGAFFCVASRGDVSWRKFGLLAVNNPAKSAVISYNDKDFAAGMPQSDLTITCKGTAESGPPRLLNLTVAGLEPSGLEPSGLEPSGPVEIGEPTVVSDGTNSTTASIPWEDLKGWKTVNISCTVWGDYSPTSEFNSTLVTVTDLPKFSDTKEPAVELDGSVGQNLTLNCSGSGRPKPTLSWTHDDKAVNCSEADKYSCKPADLQNGPSLNLKILTMEEADFGQYTCTVKSDLDKEGVSAVYNVNNADNDTPDDSSSDIIEVSASSVSESTPTSSLSSSPSPSPTPSSPPLSCPVIAAAALVGLVIVIMGGLYLAYRYRYTIRDWIMSKEVSRSALRKAKYVPSTCGGGGVFKYARLPRDNTEAMTHHSGGGPFYSPDTIGTIAKCPY